MTVQTAQNGESFAFACWARCRWVNIRRVYGFNRYMNQLCLSMWARGDRQ